MMTLRVGGYLYRVEGYPGIMKNHKNTLQVANSNNSNSKVKELKCLYTSARSLVRGSKREELQILIDKQDIDIIGITETWGKSEVLDCELDLHGFKLFRKDQNTINDKSGVDVALYVKIPYNQSNVMKKTPKNVKQCGV